MSNVMIQPIIKINQKPTWALSATELSEYLTDEGDENKLIRKKNEIAKIITVKKKKNMLKRSKKNW